MNKITEYYQAEGNLIAMNYFKKPKISGGWWPKHPNKGLNFYHKDSLGSVAMTTGRNGQAVERYEYDAYGKPYNGWYEHSAHNQNPFGFTGQRYSNQLGTWNFAYRHYNSQAMRWMTVDPVKDGTNWYAYVNADPVNLIDPLGLKKTLTVYVDQPGSGNDDDAYEKTSDGIDVGHTFVELKDTDKDEAITKGFYPSESVNPINNKEVEGIIHDNTDHPWDVKKEFELNDQQYKDAKVKIRKDESNPPDYNLDEYNCTDWVEEVVDAAGKQIPDTKGSWISGQGSNPGKLGEKLMQQGGVRNKDNTVCDG